MPRRISNGLWFASKRHVSKWLCIKMIRHPLKQLFNTSSKDWGLTLAICIFGTTGSHTTHSECPFSDNCVFHKFAWPQQKVTYCILLIQTDSQPGNISWKKIFSTYWNTCKPHKKIANVQISINYNVHPDKQLTLLLDICSY